MDPREYVGGQNADSQREQAQHHVRIAPIMLTQRLHRATFDSLIVSDIITRLSNARGTRGKRIQVAASLPRVDATYARALPAGIDVAR